MAWESDISLQSRDLVGDQRVQSLRSYPGDQECMLTHNTSKSSLALFPKSHWQ